MKTRDDLLALLGDHGQGVLVTLKRDGRPQLSNVGYAYDGSRVRVSITDDRAKTKNLRRDPRASLYVNAKNGRAYVVIEGTATLSPVAESVNDDTVRALIELYRAIGGEHPDWDEFRTAMVREKRLVLSMEMEHAYGMA
jgi:PPOX class probable F420-dependent enzyme